MNTKIIPPLLSLLAGLVALIVTYVGEAELIEILTTLFIVLLSFYVLGWIIKAIVDKLIAGDEEEIEESGEDAELENIDTETEEAEE